MEVRPLDDADRPWVAELCRRGGWERPWLVVTNDNTPALRFYQCRGWDLAALQTGAVERDRLLKPGIPLEGVDGIPVRHLLELERTVGSGGGMP
ncbi:MAG TPA: hypothetical protein VLS92_07565 [Acidimicrobiia bacterium]|nr:hypothetical protein [Acidimicrobiia bacterium]